MLARIPGKFTGNNSVSYRGGAGVAIDRVDIGMVAYLKRILEGAFGRCRRGSCRRRAALRCHGIITRSLHSFNTRQLQVTAVARAGASIPPGEHKFSRLNREPPTGGVSNRGGKRGEAYFVSRKLTSCTDAFATVKF